MRGGPRELLMTPSPLRAIPSVEKLLQALGPLDVPRPAAAAVVRRELAALRADETAARPRRSTPCSPGCAPPLTACAPTRIQPVINATGVLLHTNLGRAPLPAAAVDRSAALAANYNTLEYDLAAGERGTPRRLPGTQPRPALSARKRRRSSTTAPRRSS